MDPERMTPEEAQRELDEWAQKHNEAVAARRLPGFDEWHNKLIEDGLKHRRSRKGGRAQKVSDTELVNAFAEARHALRGIRRLGRESRKPIYKLMARKLAVSYSTIAKRLPALLRNRAQT